MFALIASASYRIKLSVIELIFAPSENHRLNAKLRFSGRSYTFDLLQSAVRTPITRRSSCPIRGVVLRPRSVESLKYQK